MKKTLLLASCLVVAALMVVGCGSGVSEDKPIVEVKQEAQTMDANQLKSMVGKYKKAIEAQKPAIQKLKTTLKAIPITQLMGDDAKAIRADIGQITTSIKKLTDRMKIYAAAFNRKK